MQLRQYQQNLINNVKLAMQNGKKKICIVLPCGGGKSICLSEIIKSANNKNNQVLVLIHRIELKNQLLNTFSNYGCNMDLTQVELVQTASRHIDKIKQPKIIICDECHLSLSDSYVKLFNAFPESFIIGCSATPIRLNEGGLGAIYDELIIGVTTKWLIENNYLSKYEVYAPVLADTSQLKIKNGDYDDTEATALFDKPKIYGDVLYYWQKLANGLKTIVFASSIEHSKKLVEMFNSNGISAAHLDGDVPKDKRAKIIEDFRSGKIIILSNFLIIAEGLDVPDCSCTVLLKPTKSTARFLQSGMRSMRFMPNKTAIIIDHCGNVFEHGLFDDDREWNLETKKRNFRVKEEKDVQARQCGFCYKIYSGSGAICKFCGCDNGKTKREIQADEAAELHRIEEIKRKEKRREQGQAQTLDELIAVGVSRGMQRGKAWYWANQIIKARSNKR